MTSVTSFDGARAWGGDPARKQASIAAADTALKAVPGVGASSRLRLVAADRIDDFSEVYSAAYGTADPAVLEARAGLPASTLMLASAALSGCNYSKYSSEGYVCGPLLVDRAIQAPIAALEAIRVGADPLSLARCYMVDLLGRLADLRDRDDRGLAPEHRALVSQLASAHDEGSADSAALRSLRRAIVAAADSVTGEFEKAVLKFAESVAWPLAGLAGELPGFVDGLHSGLSALLTPEPLSEADRATLDGPVALFQSIEARIKADPGFDYITYFRSSPEFKAAQAPAFQVRLERSYRVAAESYAPFAIDLLIGAFRKA